MIHLGTADRTKIPGGPHLIVTACGRAVSAAHVVTIRQYLDVECPDCRPTAYYAEAERITKEADAEAALRADRLAAANAARARRDALTAARDRVVEAAREETEAEAAWTWEAVTKMQESEAYARVEAARKERRAAVAALLALNEGRSE